MARKPDPAARQVLQLIGAGRIGIGIVALLATGPALRLLGFREPSAEARVLARMAGGRDLALGVLTLAAAGDRRALRAAALLGAAVDALAAQERHREGRRVQAIDGRPEKRRGA